MKITQIEYNDNDGNGFLQILIDGKRVFRVHDGEPEDNNLCRNFSDCWSIVELLQQAYEAGKRGEPFEIENYNG